MKAKFVIDGYKFIPGGKKRAQLTKDVALVNATFEIGTKTHYGVLYVNETNKGDVERIAFFVDGKVYHNNNRRILRILGVTRKDYRQKRYSINGKFKPGNYHLVAGTNRSIKIKNYEKRYRAYNTHGLHHFDSWTGIWNKNNQEHVDEVIRRYRNGMIDFNRCTNKEYEILVENGICEAV